MKILVCDDEPSVSLLVSMVLEAEGHQVETAFDGQDALEKIQVHPCSFEVLVTDLKMPRLNGIELIEKLQALNIQLKVLMITGFASQLGDKAEARLLFNRLLPKPFRVSELLDCFHDLVC